MVDETGVIRACCRLGQSLTPANWRMGDEEASITDSEGIIQPAFYTLWTLRDSFVSSARDRIRPTTSDFLETAR